MRYKLNYSISKNISDNNIINSINIYSRILHQFENHDIVLLPQVLHTTVIIRMIFILFAVYNLLNSILYKINCLKLLEINKRITQ